MNYRCNLSNITMLMCSQLIAIFCETAIAAPTCNPKAQTHQEKAYLITLSLQQASKDDLAFLLCMTSEPEDKAAYENSWKKAQAKREALAAQQARMSAKQAEKKQAELQLAAERAKAESIQEVQADRIVIPPITTNPQEKQHGFYIGRVTPDDVIIIELQPPQRSNVNIMLNSPMTGQYKPGLPLPLGHRLTAGDLGGRSKGYEMTDKLRLKVRDSLRSGHAPGQASDAFLGVASVGKTQVKVTVLCVQRGTANPPCDNR